MVKPLDIAISKQMNDRTNFLRYPNGPLSPPAPIIPTVDTFDAGSMANLDRVVNGDYTDYAGIGTKTTGGYGVVGNLIFDLGANYVPVRVSAALGLYVSDTSKQLNVYVDQSDSTTFPSAAYAVAQNATTGETFVGINEIKVVKRYFRLRFLITGAATGNVKVYQVEAHREGA